MTFVEFCIKILVQEVKVHWQNIMCSMF